MVVVGIIDKLPPYDPNSSAPPLYPVRKGTFLFLNSSGADQITLANGFTVPGGQTCYAVDDETVALTSDTNLRPVAGTIVDVESDGVCRPSRKP
jgi:hypothetical protein